MRMRKKKNGMERLLACGDIVLTDPAAVRNNGVVYELEIGCGKGGFITALAAREPDKRFIAMERCTDVIMLAAEKASAAGLTNILFLNADAKDLPLWLGKGQVSRLYLNFSDPWPKKGYYKRRLTYSAFLDLYKQVLIPDGVIALKTDNPVLFDFSLESFAANGFECRAVTRDLHHSEWAADNIMTEYEANFAAQGMTINRLEAHRLPDPPKVPDTAGDGCDTSGKE